MVITSVYIYTGIWCVVVELPGEVCVGYARGVGELADFTDTARTVLLDGLSLVNFNNVKLL